MMKLQNLSDATLNLEIARLVWPNKIGNRFADGAIGVDNGTAYGTTVDYVNDWNDLMPEVVEYLSCAQIHNCFNAYEDNPRRALAECLLMVLLEKRQTLALDEMTALDQEMGLWEQGDETN